MGNFMDCLRYRRDSIRSYRSLEMGNYLWIYRMGIGADIPAHEGQLVPLLFLAKKYDSIMRMMKIIEE